MDEKVKVGKSGEYYANGKRMLCIDSNVGEDRYVHKGQTGVKSRQLCPLLDNDVIFYDHLLH